MATSNEQMAGEQPGDDHAAKAAVAEAAVAEGAVVKGARAAAGRLAKKADELGQQLKSLAKMHEDMDRHAFSLPPAAQDAINRLQQLEAELAAVGECRDWLEATVVRAERVQVRTRARLAGGISAALESLELPVSGQIPELHAGVLLVELQFESATARVWFGPKISELRRCDLDPESVLAAVKAEWDELRSGDWDDPAYHARLAQAWRVCAARAGQAADAQTAVPLADIYREMVWSHQTDAFASQPTKGRFREYPIHQFAFDLFRLRERTVKGTEIRLHVATREQTRKKGESLWVPRNSRGDGTHFASLTIRRTEGAR